VPTDDWERGYAAGWRAAQHTDVRDISRDMGEEPASKPKKKKRKASSYNKKYGAAFKKLAPKYKKKNGQWKKDGFKRCGAAARKEAKR
tara:strand:+ start:722 stop:985 length:264 start_codon:yes stop_codon:yes gene_type:complete